MTAEHTLIGKLTDSGMSYADIEGLVDSSDGADSKSGDDADSGSADDEFVGQTSFFGDNSALPGHIPEINQTSLQSH